MVVSVEKYTILSPTHFLSSTLGGVEWTALSFDLLTLENIAHGDHWIGSYDVTERMWTRGREGNISSAGIQPRSTWSSTNNHLPALTELPSSINSSVICAVFNHIKCGTVRNNKLTYLLHGAESFLRSQLVLQLVKKFPHFMEPESSSPCSQVLAIYPYPEPTPSSLHLLPLPEDPS